MVAAPPANNQYAAMQHQSSFGVGFAQQKISIIGSAPPMHYQSIPSSMGQPLATPMQQISRLSPLL
jgi:hypothetical protein